MQDGDARRVVVLIPLYDDWTSLQTLLRRLDEALSQAHLRAEVLVVNDASPSDGTQMDLAHAWQSIDRLRVLDLRRNLGHQRAICIGLAWLEAQGTAHSVVVMDGDGEDEPRDIAKLLEAHDREGGRQLVFARRCRRYESLAFRLLYFVYHTLFGLLTGHEIRVGNFSVVSPAVLRRLVVVSELWNHYAAAAQKARIPVAQIPIDRGKRIAGRSKMNYTALVTHGLSSISVHGDTVGSRMLIVASLLIVAALAGLLSVVGVAATTHVAIPGWAVALAGLLGLLVLQACMLSLFFILMILGARTSPSFIPSRDYGPFVDEVRSLSLGSCPVGSAR